VRTRGMNLMPVLALAVGLGALLAARPARHRAPLPPRPASCAEPAGWHGAHAMAGRGKKLVKKALMLAFALAACLQTMPVSAAQAATSAASSTLCLKSQHRIVHSRFGARYQIRNSYWRGQRRQCIHNSGDRDNFTITQRPGFDPAGREVAFPHIFRGCAWKICSPNAGIPIKVSAIGHLVTTWHTRENASGTWNAAYDIWFGKRRMTTGQATGAELMIWLNHHGRCCALQHGAPKVWIDGRPCPSGPQEHPGDRERVVGSGLGPDRAAAVTVAGTRAGKAYVQHLLADRAQQLREAEPACAGEQRLRTAGALPPPLNPRAC